MTGQRHGRCGSSGTVCRTPSTLLLSFNGVVVGCLTYNIHHPVGISSYDTHFLATAGCIILWAMASSKTIICPRNNSTPSLSVGDTAGHARMFYGRKSG
ncbi:hypothetical protein F4810DRAFT_518361 [Camillea tinctor]|nr:hypothetical protein F4810DRAFT_518361 [Camillea tinctor]